MRHRKGVAWLLVSPRTLRQRCLCAPHRHAYCRCCITRATGLRLTDGGSATRRSALSAIGAIRC